MSGNFRKHLFDIKRSCEAVMDFMADRSLADLQRDRLLRSGVRYELQSIGEAIVRMRHASADLGQMIAQWRRIISFRNLLVHGYDVVEETIVYAIATRDVPNLLREVEALLAAAAEDAGDDGGVAGGPDD
ncbi:MAG: DUF86 domain-containing protein [Armatimonadetes bacterium]|nr:DUF86 domain-containing protein [Armatimonadota bacterium]